MFILKKTCLISFIFGVMILRSEASDELHPKAVISERNFDFEKIALNTTAFHEFKIINQGKAPLRFLNLTSDCACTAAIAGSLTLGPGETSPIQVTFNALGRRGKFQKTIQVHTDDPLNPILELAVSGVIEEGLAVAPSMLEFGRVHQGEIVERQFVVRYPAFSPQGIRFIEPLSEVETKHEPDFSTSPPGTRIKVKLKSNLPIGILNRSLVLQLRNPQLSPFQIPIHARIIEPFEVKPTSLLFLVKENVVPEEKMLQIIQHSRKPFKIEKLEYDQNFFHVEHKRAQSPRGYLISIKLKKDFEPINTETQLSVITQNPEYPKITIPIQILVLRKALSDKL